MARAADRERYLMIGAGRRAGRPGGPAARRGQAKRAAGGRSWAGRVALGRSAQVVRIVARHGARLARRRLEGARGGVAREVRETLGDLGPTFVKLGQVLSTRPDIVPPALESELATLQDAATPVPPDAALRALRRELGRDPAVVFAEFDEDPIASASIGQVHGARLVDGGEVVVKLRRPGVATVVEQDLVVLALGASVLGRIPGLLRRVDVVGFVEQFAETIRGELDYVAEGRNAEQVRRDLADLPVHVPAVVWDATTHGVLTLERIHGTKIDDLEALDREGVDRPALARTLARVYLSMVFTHGFFHADPHPGNFFVEPGGRLAMVDFGMVGTVPDEVRLGLVQLLLALVAHDTRRLLASMRRLGVVPASVDEDRLVMDLDRLTASSIEVAVGELRLAPLVADLMGVSRRHRLAFPRDLALLVKTVVMCEGLAARLDPAFALPEVLVAFAATGLGGAGRGRPECPERGSNPHVLSDSGF